MLTGGKFCEKRLFKLSFGNNFNISLKSDKLFFDFVGVGSSIFGFARLFAYCFGMVGYHMLIWLSGIERISPEYYEAATIDGATKPAQFRYMTLPLLKGVFKTNITMWSVSSVGFFVWSQLFSTVTADTQTITPYVYMYMQIFGGGNTVTERNAGLGAAIGVLLSICVVIVFTFCNRVIKDDDLEF